MPDHLRDVVFEVAGPTHLEHRLLVRIYPEPLAVDTHEPQLTDAEATDATVYWTEVLAAGADANRALGWHADERNYRLAATMLRELGVHRVRLLTNNPDKVGALGACGVEVVSREPLVVGANGTNDGYLATKARRFGHLL